MAIETIYNTNYIYETIPFIKCKRLGIQGGQGPRRSCDRCKDCFFKSNRGGTAIPDAINVILTPEYAPLLKEIDKACNACKISRSGLVRALLCDIFEFTPERAKKPYNSYKKRVQKESPTEKAGEKE